MSFSLSLEAHIPRVENPGHLIVSVCPSPHLWRPISWVENPGHLYNICMSFSPSLEPISRVESPGHTHKLPAVSKNQEDMVMFRMPVWWTDQCWMEEKYSSQPGNWKTHSLLSPCLNYLCQKKHKEERINGRKKSKQTNKQTNILV